MKACCCDDLQQSLPSPLIINNNDDLEQAVENFMVSLKVATESTTRITTEPRWKGRLSSEHIDLVNECSLKVTSKEIRKKNIVR